MVIVNDMSRKESDPWVRTFTVTDPIKHKKGYTLYKVTSKVFPKNSVEAVTQVTVWKRYNDFKKLHKALHALHQGLYLKGTFPPFAKARFFGRFDDQVVEERRQCALELLEFVAKYPPLFTSQIFVKFFEFGQVIENPPLNEKEENCLDPVLKPVNFNTSTYSSSSSQLDEKENNSTLGGIWQHRRAADEISLSSQNATEDEDDDRTTFTDDDHPSAGKLSIDLAEFDPILENSIAEETCRASRSGTLCNEWLISAFQSFNVTSAEKKDSDDVLEFPTPFGNFEDLESIRKTDSQLNGDVGATNDATDIETRDLDLFCDSAVKSSPVCSNTETSSIPDERAHCGAKFDSTYIFHSAKLVSAAHNAETTGNVFEAFTLYKTAVDTLLQGVKDDKCPEQSEVVRRKVLQYLKRAEKLYENYLASGKKNDLCNFTGQHPTTNVALGRAMNLQLRKPITDLGKYRVIGILSRVILVVNTVSNSTCVVKVLRKSPSPMAVDTPNIAPRGIKFMVDLHEVYETKDAVYLILEYASGGRLWDYVSTYLQQSPIHTNNNDPEIVPESVNKSSLANIYSAKKVAAKKPSIPLMKTNLAEPTVTITTAASSDDVDDLKPAAACPPSYIALFKNYLVTTVSNKERCLAQCNIKDSASSVAAGDAQTECTISETDAKFSLNLSNGIPDLKYIDEPASCANNEEKISVNGEDTDESLESSFPNNGSPKYPESCVNKIKDDGKTVDDIICDSKALMEDVDNVLHSARRSSLNNLESNIKEQNRFFKQDESHTIKRSATSFMPYVDHKDLKTFLSADIGKSFLKDPDKVMKCSNVIPLEVEKSNTLTYFSSSTGTLDLTGAARFGLSEIFNQMDVDMLAAKPSHLPEVCIARWGAEIITVLDALHKMGIVWQDLNPNNILLGSEGHVLLTYQSQWNCIDHVLSSDAKKNLYTAPEVGRVFPVTPCCDWWSLGAILFELLTGKKLSSCHPSGITSHTTLSLPDFLTTEAEDILKQLLRYNDSERLGSGPHGIEDIKYHPFFHSVDWNMLNAC